MKRYFILAVVFALMVTMLATNVVFAKGPGPSAGTGTGLCTGTGTGICTGTGTGTCATTGVCTGTGTGTGLKIARRGSGR